MEHSEESEAELDLSGEPAVDLHDPLEPPFHDEQIPPMPPAQTRRLRR